MNATRYIQSRKAAGAEVIFKPDGGLRINIVILRKEKSSLLIEKNGPNSENSVASAKELTKVISASTPVSLTLAGKGIIYKKISGAAGDPDQQLLQKALPNALMQDFYIQKYPVNEHELYVSVARKEQVDNLLREFAANKLQVISCSFGPFIAALLIPLLEENLRHSELNLPGYILSLSGEKLTDIRVNEITTVSTSLAISNDLIPAYQFIPFASAFSYFIGNGYAEASIPSIVCRRSEFRSQMIFKSGGVAALSFFMLVLLINFLFFHHYWARKSEMELKLSAHQKILREFETLKQEVRARQAFLEGSGLLESSRISWHADQLASEVPASIRLTGLQIFPPEKKADQDTLLHFRDNIIQVSGQTRKSTELNDWIRLIKQKKWISDVAIIHYAQERDQPFGNFSLEIQTKQLHK